MKFCMILEFFVPHYNGGGERRYYELTKRLVEQGHEVDILTMKVDNAPDHEQVDGVNIHRLGPVIKQPPIRSKTDFIKYLKAVISWINNHSYSIIDAQAYSPLLSGLIASKITKTPLIATIYDTSRNSNDQWIQFSKLASIAEKILVKLPYTRVLTISDATRNSLINDFNIKNKNIDVMYIGVDLDTIDKVECNETAKNRLLFVGRLVPHKHVDHLLEVLNNIKDNYPGIKLVIVGKGIEKENLIEYINNHKLGDYVEFMQDLTNEELIYQMKLANLLVLPSTREGFGMVLSEANACHTPTIAYASGGVVEVVDDGISGYLIKPNNKEQLQEKIEHVLSNKNIEEQLADGGRRRVEDIFNWDKIVEDYVNFASKTINCNCKGIKK
ncbi:glycosyltransferase family 4 protein [Methanosphaera cuniculi]|uniref:Spore coat protein SA n=1 Tax=Methanosphaera cuniculi TaxID=1077256 RepID=A0A2A2HFC6_9EURY|nr:glycosyltransferase family 4 protein [Methanosphaera cuniculi]PAV08000.1 hypothetical protein ASJ82_04965 [Methanosphaera cuniculi]PWL08731.1 spore coat protein SA [Methanosphaera cuniculi]